MRRAFHVRSWSWTVAVPIVALAAPASAEEAVRGARVHLQIADGIANCPTESAFAERVRAASGTRARDSRSPDAATNDAEAPRDASESLEDVELSVTIVRDTGGSRGGSSLMARVVARGGRVGQRTLWGTSCAGLADALVVLVAMIVDEEVRAARAALAPAAEPAAEPAPETAAGEDGDADGADPEEPAPVPSPARTAPAVPAPVASEAPKGPRRGVGATDRGGALALRALASAGASTEGTEVVAGGFELGWRAWTARALGAWRLPHDVVLPPGRIRSEWVGGMVAGCRAVGDAFRFVGCAQGWVGMLHAAATDFSSGTTYDRPWTALGASGGVETGGRVRLGLDAVGLLPLNRDRFHVTNVGTWEAGRPTAWLFARLGVDFR